MKKTIYALACSLGLAFTPVAKATPYLQLDIAGGTYNVTDQSTIAAGNEFNLYALALGSGDPVNSGPFYISAALVKLDGTAITAANTPANTDLGTFKFGNSTVSAVSGMIFGNPPIEANLTAGWDSGDLSKHGIFPTWFQQFPFVFVTGQTTAEYNAQEDAYPAHNEISDLNLNGTMYYVSFAVDVSNLAAGYGLHFDLYNESVLRSGDIDRNQFAPFSHDASGYHHNVPDGGATLALLGLSLLGFGLMARRKA